MPRTWAILWLVAGALARAETPDSLVEEVVVVGVPTSYGDEKVKAVVVRRGECSEEDLVEHCRGKIADFKVPSLIEFRETLPKSPTGKIRRMMLIDPVGDG